MVDKKKKDKKEDRKSHKRKSQGKKKKASFLDNLKDLFGVHGDEKTRKKSHKKKKSRSHLRPSEAIRNVKNAAAMEKMKKVHKRKEECRAKTERPKHPGVVHVRTSKHGQTVSSFFVCFTY